MSSTVHTPESPARALKRVERPLMEPVVAHINAGDRAIRRHARSGITVETASAPRGIGAEFGELRRAIAP